MKSTGCASGLPEWQAQATVFYFALGALLLVRPQFPASKSEDRVASEARGLPNTWNAASSIFRAQSAQ
jgi:hypothetical protein